MVLCAWEHRRFFFSRRRSPLPSAPWPRVALIAPCRGLDLDLESNLRPLFEQDYPDYELVFVVDSARDPARGVIESLGCEYADVRWRLVVAGPARGCGQKVHNLLAATKDLPRDVKILAFVDSDARPHRDWIRRLVGRLRRSDAGAATGYRWFFPRPVNLAGSLLAGVNAGIAGLLGSHSHNLAWGGSWVIRRKVFDAIGMRRHWQGALSDDLVASSVLRRAGLRVVFEPNCFVASPLSVTFAGALEFIRRQYVMARFYAPRWWLSALAAATLGNTAFWGGLGLLCYELVRGGQYAWIPLVGTTLLYVLGAVRGWLRQDAGRPFFPQYELEFRRAGRIDIWAPPLIWLFNWVGLASSVLGRRVVWRGIRYRLGAKGRVVVESSPAVDEVASPPAHGPRRRRVDSPTRGGAAHLRNPTSVVKEARAAQGSRSGNGIAETSGG